LIAGSQPDFNPEIRQDLRVVPYIRGRYETASNRSSADYNLSCLGGRQA
jgi:hypothetical protein